MPLPSTRNVPSVPVVVPTVAGPTAAATADDTALPALDPLLDAADAAELTLVDAADAGELATAEVVDVDPELHAAASNPMANMAPVSRQAVDQRFRAPSMVTPFVDARAPFWARREFSLGLSKPGVAGSGDVVSPVIQMSIGAPPCAVSRFITLSSSSGLATVPASTVLGDSVVVVKPGRNDRADWPDRAADMDLVVDHGACSRPTPVPGSGPAADPHTVRVAGPRGVRCPALQSVDDADQRGLVRDGASEHRFDGLSNDPDVVEFCQDVGGHCPSDPDFEVQCGHGVGSPSVDECFPVVRRCHVRPASGSFEPYGIRDLRPCRRTKFVGNLWKHEDACGSGRHGDPATSSWRNVGA